MLYFSCSCCIFHLSKSKFNCAHGLQNTRNVFRINHCNTSFPCCRVLSLYTEEFLNGLCSACHAYSPLGQSTFRGRRHLSEPVVRVLNVIHVSLNCGLWRSTSISTVTTQLILRITNQQYSERYFNLCSLFNRWDYVYLFMV